jgi:hypothetical protein
LVTSTSLLYLVPAFAVLIGFVWLGEVPLLGELLGGLVVIAGVVLVGLAIASCVECSARAAHRWRARQSTYLSFQATFAGRASRIEANGMGFAEARSSNGTDCRLVVTAAVRARW